MKTTTANYDTENAKINPSPVIVVDFGITRIYSSDTFGDITADYKKYISTMMISLQNMDLLQAPLALLGQSTFEILDKGLDVTDQLKDNDMEGRDITVKLGYQGLDIADFVSLPVTNTEKVQMAQGTNAWRFITKDARKLLTKQLFRAPPTNNLNGALNNAVGTVTLDSTAGFIDPSNYPDFFGRQGNRAHVLVSGKEVISYTAITGTGHGGGNEELTGAGRGAEQTAAIAHEDNAEVVQFYTINGGGTAKLQEWLLSILMTTDDGSGHAYYDLASFDSGFDRMGLGLSASEVNIRNIERMGLWFPASAKSIWGFAPTDAVKFIEDKILKPMGWYMYLDKDGKLTVGCYDRVWVDLMFDIGNLWDSNGDAVPADTIVTADIINGNFVIGTDKLINQIEIREEKNPLSAESKYVKTYKLDESVTDYGATKKPFVIDTILSLGSLAGLNIVIYGHAYRWLYFWGNTPGFIKLRTHFDKWLLEPGDFVQITYDKFPELKDATQGWTTKKALVTGQPIIDWLSEPSSFELDLITWELFNKVALETSFTTVVVGDIDDTGLAFNATNDNTLDAEDAYVDLDGAGGKENSPTVQYCIATIEVAEPGGGTGHQWIEIELYIQNPAGTNVGNSAIDKSFNYIRYDAAGGGTYDILLPIILQASVTMARFKIDWFDRSSAVGADQPTLTFKKLRYFTFPKAMSEVT